MGGNCFRVKLDVVEDSGLGHLRVAVGLLHSPEELAAWLRMLA